MKDDTGESPPPIRCQKVCPNEQPHGPLDITVICRCGHDAWQRRDADNAAERTRIPIMRESLTAMCGGTRRRFNGRLYRGIFTNDVNRNFDLVVSARAMIRRRRRWSALSAAARLGI
jgi:hypothetical protein